MPGIILDHGIAEEQDSADSIRNWIASHREQCR
jgi:hypothetical protein